MEATKNVAVFYIIKEGINDKEAVRNVAVFIRNNGGASPALQLRQQDFPRVQKRILHTLQLSLFFIGFGGILGWQIVDFLGGWGYFIGWKTDLRAYNKMTLYSSGLFFVLTASGCINNASALRVWPSLQDKKTLAFVTTIHFVRDSKDERKIL